MNLGSWVVLVVLVLIVALAIRSMIKDHKKHKGGCAGCNGCVLGTGCNAADSMVRDAEEAARRQCPKGLR